MEKLETKNAKAETPATKTLQASNSNPRNVRVSTQREMNKSAWPGKTIDTLVLFAMLGVVAGMFWLFQQNTTNDLQLKYLSNQTEQSVRTLTEIERQNTEKLSSLSEKSIAFSFEIEQLQRTIKELEQTNYDHLKVQLISLTLEAAEFASQSGVPLERIAALAGSAQKLSGGLSPETGNQIFVAIEQDLKNITNSEVTDYSYINESLDKITMLVDDFSWKHQREVKKGDVSSTEFDLVQFFKDTWDRLLTLVKVTKTDEELQFSLTNSEKRLLKSVIKSIVERAKTLARLSDAQAFNTAVDNLLQVLEPYKVLLSENELEQLNKALAECEKLDIKAKSLLFENSSETINRML